MANNQNLIPFTSEQNREEAKKNGKKGGKKSGEVRRKRKAMKEQMEMLLALPFNLKNKYGEEIVDELTFLGIDKNKIDNQMAMLISLWKTAISNDSQKIQAVREIREIVQDNQNETKEERIQIVNDLPEDDNNEPN